MQRLLDLLCGPADPPPTSSVEAWWRRHAPLRNRFEQPIDVAIAGGFEADRLAWAFASGYHAATTALDPTSPRDRRTALCATEAGGAHPDRIETALLGGRLAGLKGFVTLGTHAEELLVLASEGRDADGRNRLKLVRIPADRPGVRIQRGAELPFVPEIPHAAVELVDVAVDPDEVLPGDGWVDWVRPFRTVEDLHVHGALLGWIIAVAPGPPELVESALATALAVRQLAALDPRSASVHRAFGGVAESTRALLDRADWSRVDPEVAARWERDRPLLKVAGKARAARLRKARG